MKTLLILAAIAAMNYGLYTWNKGPATGKALANSNHAAVRGGQVIYFGAPWCGPCRHARPLAEELAQEMSGKVAFRFVNVDDEPSLAEEYGIRSIPMLVIVQDGNEKARFHGGSKEQMREEISRNL